MPSARAFKFVLASILTAAALSLPAIASAQTLCPGPGGTSGDCVNTSDQNYTDSPSTTVTGIFSNEAAGQVTATSNTTNAVALTVNEFINHSTVTADGSGGGTGIYLDQSGFTNQAGGTVTATGQDYSFGIYIDNGNFTNSGTVTAAGYGDGLGFSEGYGLYLHNGNFTNSGELTLISNGSNALYFLQYSAANTFTAQGGSSLVMAGSSPAMAFAPTGSQVGTLTINPTAKLTLLSANTISVGSKTFVVAENVGDTGASKFVMPGDSLIFSYDQAWRHTSSGDGSGGDYEVTATRQAWASDLTGGEGGRFVESLENYFAANGTGGAAAQGWLELLHDINSQSTVGDIKRGSSG